MQAGRRQLRGGGAARAALRGAAAAAQGLGQLDPEEQQRPHLRGRVRRHAHHALAGQPGEGGGGELPREGHPRGRPRLADLDRRRHLVDGAHGGGPPEAARDGEAFDGRLHPRHVATSGCRTTRRCASTSTATRRWPSACCGATSTYGVTNQQSRGGSQDATAMRAGTVDDPMVTGRAAEVYFQADDPRCGRPSTCSSARSTGSRAPRAASRVILVSEGFIHDINLDEFKRVNKASRRANTAIYFLNARGLEGMPAEMTAQFGPALPEQDVGFAFAETLDAVAGSEVVSSESGGFTVRNTNDLGKGIQTHRRRDARLLPARLHRPRTPRATASSARSRSSSRTPRAARCARARATSRRATPARRAFAPKKGVDPVVQSALDSPWAMDAHPAAHDGTTSATRRRSARRRCW